MATTINPLTGQLVYLSTHKLIIHKLINSQTHELINSQTHKLTTYKPINSQTHKLKNLQTHKLTILKLRLLFYKTYFVRHPILEKLRVKSMLFGIKYHLTRLSFAPFLRKTIAFSTILPFQIVAESHYFNPRKLAFWY